MNNEKHDAFKNNIFIEEFSFCEINYDFKKFKGIKEIVSPKYGFLVLFWNDKDFRFKGNIAYKIYIPYSSLKDYKRINELNDFLNDIRTDIEKEIFDYLKSKDLVEEVCYC